MNFRFFSFFFSLLVLSLIACEDKKEEPGPLPPRDMVPRTVLVYIVGDNGSNDLSNLLEGNFNDMKLGMKEVNAEECNLIVYSEMISDVPHLIQITKKNGKVVADTLYTYPERNPLSQTVMTEVIQETVRLFPAESYGLVFLSHSDAWKPASKVAPLAVGDYRGTQMNIADFRTVLLDAFPQKLKFILFDSCFMQAVEVGYELRDCTDYIIGSPTEIPGPGAPYDIVTPYLFADQDVEEKIADAYFQYYMDNYNKSSDWSYGVSVSVIKTDALEQLAKITRTIIPTYIQNGSAIGTAGIMYYDRSSKRYYYDFDGLITKLTAGNETQYSQWRAAYDEAVPYWKTTPTNYSIYIPGTFLMAGSAGMSTYIPRGQITDWINVFYHTYQWYQDAGWADAGW